MKDVALALAGVLVAAAWAQQPAPVFRIDASLVRVDAQAVSRGRVIAGLQKDDFVLFEDGRPQPVVHFGVETDPVDLLLLIDKSGSMQPVVAELLLGSGDALSLSRAGDRVAVMLFDEKSELLVPFTERMEQVTAGLERVLRQENIQGGTNIDGAVLNAARYMRQQPRTAARRSILILTDNRSYKTKRERTVLTELWEADAVLNALIFQSGWERAARRYQQVVSPWGLLLAANVNRFVEQTGGESLRAQAPVESLREMLDRIRTRYTMHYRAPAGPAGRKRSIRVALSGEALRQHPGATVRARRGYIPAEVVR